MSRREELGLSKKAYADHIADTIKKVRLSRAVCYRDIKKLGSGLEKAEKELKEIKDKMDECRQDYKEIKEMLSKRNNVSLKLINKIIGDDK